VHEVVGGVHAFERWSEAPRIEDVCADDFGAFVEDMAKELGASCEAADPHAGPLELPEQPAADVPGRAGEQDEGFPRHVGDCIGRTAI
jgi:hypothetical protein